MASNETVYQVKVTLNGVRPPIWRRLLVASSLSDLGVEGIGNSPDEFAAVIKSGIPKWAMVIKDSGIKPD